jgi:hypothetical protein
MSQRNLMRDSKLKNYKTLTRVVNHYYHITISGTERCKTQISHKTFYIIVKIYYFAKDKQSSTQQIKQTIYNI